MSKSRLEFNGDSIRRQIEVELKRRIARCAILIWSHWKELISVDGTGIREKSGKTRAGQRGKRKGGLVYGANPSKPGDPPRKQTGRLLASAAWEIIGLVARIGTNLGYGRILEMGGKRVKARPSLRRAAQEKTAECEAILGAPMKGP